MLDGVKMEYSFLIESIMYQLQLSSKDEIVMDNNFKICRTRKVVDHGSVSYF